MRELLYHEMEKVNRTAIENDNDVSFGKDLKLCFSDTIRVLESVAILREEWKINDTATGEGDELLREGIPCVLEENVHVTVSYINILTLSVLILRVTTQCDMFTMLGILDYDLYYCLKFRDKRSQFIDDMTYNMAHTIKFCSYLCYIKVRLQ